MFQFQQTAFYTTYYEVNKEFGIKYSASKVFSFVVNVCANLNKKYGENAFCGYSNIHIAEFLDLSLATVKRAIKSLKEKGLILIEESGCFKRRIKPNYDVLNKPYEALPEDQQKDSSNDEEINKLKKALEDKDRLIEELKEALKGNSSNGSEPEEPLKDSPYTDRLFELIEFTDVQKADIQKFVEPRYREFVEKYGFTFDLLENHFLYLKDHMDLNEVGHLKNYLIKSLKGYRKHLLKKRKEFKESNEPMKADGSTLPDWYKEVPTELADNELIAKFRAKQEELKQLK